MNIENLYQLDTTQGVQQCLCRPVLDPLMEALSTVGEGWCLALLMIALARVGNRARRDALRTALRGLAVLAVTGALVVATKRIFNTPRPLQVLGAAQVRVLLEPLHRMSFPSGHSAAAAALAMWAWVEPSVRTRGWPWLLALLVGLSRVYVGAHWVTDVVAGWSLGVLTAAAVMRAARQTRAASAGLAGSCAGSVGRTGAGEADT